MNSSTPGNSTDVSMIFSGRAETPVDILHAVRQLSMNPQIGGLTKVTIELGFFEPGRASGEAMVEMHFDRPVSVQWVNDQVRSVPDGHVLHQTLRPIQLQLNLCERDYDKR